MDDDVSIDELQKAVEQMYGVPARFVEAVEVDERFIAVMPNLHSMEGPRRDSRAGESSTE